MAKITITEIDSTIYGLSTTSTDNVVFVPGTSITGPTDPTLCQSYAEFTSIFGDTPPAGDVGTRMCNWEYAANILIAGFPVLFRRITTNRNGESLVDKAIANINVLDGSSTIKVGEVVDKFGGSFGNRLKYRFVRNTGSIYFVLYQDYTIGTAKYDKQVESIKLIDITNTDTQETITRKLVESINKTFKSNYIDINITNDEKFYFASSTDFVYLDGGKDADNIEAATYGPSVYNELIDKLIYDVKFITSGGWTDFQYDNNTYIDFSSNMAGIESVVTKRQDCVAVVDIPFGEPRENVRTYFSSRINTSYATAYAPWAFMTLETGTNRWCPPSFVFLKTLANSIKSGNKIWFPPAGVRRATVGDIIEMEYPVGSSLLDEWQNDSPQYINPIMRLLQYGYVIYGQRTLMRSVDGSTDKRSALQELGVRITANEIKRRINDIALQLTFEQNNIHTWNEFRGLLDPFMSQLLNDGALYSYEIIMDETTTTNVDIDENRIVGVVRANITRAAEDFEIGFELTSSSVVLSES